MFAVSNNESEKTMQERRVAQRRSSMDRRFGERRRPDRALAGRGAMEGSRQRAGGVACVRDVRHPIDAALAVMEDGRHVLLSGAGASRFARERGIEMCDPAIFITDRKRQELLQGADTVGAVARDSEGHLAVAVSTGGVRGKLPGRIGDSPIPGAGLYVDDRFGGVCGTGLGEAFIRLGLARLMVVELQHGLDAESVAQGAVDHLSKALRAPGGVIVIPRERSEERREEREESCGGAVGCK